MGLWGVARATSDLDFLVDREDLEKVDAVMKKLGYECRFRSENVTNTSPGSGSSAKSTFCMLSGAPVSECLNAPRKKRFSGAS